MLSRRYRANTEAYIDAAEFRNEVLVAEFRMAQGEAIEVAGTVYRANRSIVDDFCISSKSEYRRRFHEDIEQIRRRISMRRIGVSGSVSNGAGRGL